MNINPTLETERLLIRRWRDCEEDRAFMHFIMSNEVGRRYYQERKTREGSDLGFDKILTSYENGLPAWQVATLKNTGQPVGFCGLCPINFPLSFPATTEIGWQYDPAFWGKGYASEAATAHLDHAFNTLKLKDIVAFAIEENRASTRVMEKIGMVQEPENTFLHPSISDDHPHLKRHVLYRVTAHQWLHRNA